MSTTPWVKSSRSGQNQCVETRWCDGCRQVRDSKDPHGPVLSFSPETFAAFVDTLKSGSLDRPA